MGLCPLTKKIFEFLCVELTHFCALLIQAYLYFLSQFCVPFQEKFVSPPQWGWGLRPENGAVPPAQKFFGVCLCGINAFCTLLTEAYPYFLSQFCPLRSWVGFGEVAVPLPIFFSVICVELTHLCALLTDAYLYCNFSANSVPLSNRNSRRATAFPLTFRIPLRTNSL